MKSLTENEAQIRELIESWAEAVRQRKMDSILASNAIVSAVRRKIAIGTL